MSNPYGIPEAQTTEALLNPNPYGAPKACLDFRGGKRGVWREGRNLLYVSRDGEVPRRCVKCNGEVAGPVKLRNFYWHSSALYLLILLNIFIYAIIAMFVRKQVLLSPALCAAHARRRRNALFAAFGGFLLGLPLALFAILNDWAALAALLFFGGLFGGIAGAFMARIVYPVHVDERGAKFKGCGEAFLASLDGSAAY